MKVHKRKSIAKVRKMLVLMVLVAALVVSLAAQDEANSQTTNYLTASRRAGQLDLPQAWALTEAKVRFEPYCFLGTDLPKGNFENPSVVEGLIGPYQLQATYFDANFQPVTKADQIGRYGVVFEAKPQQGRCAASARSIKCPQPPPCNII